MELYEHVSRIVARSKAFYSATEPGHFLIGVHLPVEVPPLPPLYEYDPETHLEQWLDLRLESSRPAWEAKADIDDDIAPTICPAFGIAEHSAWLGMKVRAQQNTNLPVPLLNSLDEVEKLTLSDQTPWFRYMKDGYDYLRSKKDGTFLLSVRGGMTPMDLADAVRGNEIYVEMLTEPEKVHRLLKFLTEAEAWYFSQLRSWADEVEGGHFFTWAFGWAPNAIGHLSNDAAMLCSYQVYKEFGYPYEVELVKDYECVLYHIHNEKLHFVPHLVELPNLALLEISNDPMMPAPIEDLPRIFAHTGKANLLLHATSDQVRDHIEELKVRNVFFDVSCRDRADAEDIVAFVREQSKPL